MDQGYKLKNRNTELNARVIFKNLNGSFNGRVMGKVSPFQGYLYKEQVSNELLNNLPSGDAQNLFSAMDLVYLGSREYIYQPDDFIRYLYFPETAVISEYQILEDGKTVEVAMTGPEGIVGISSLFNSSPSPNWSQVIIPGKALRIDAKLFRIKRNCCQTFQKILFEFLNSYISQITQRVICNNYHTVEERLCLWLLMINDRCGNDTLPFTQEQVARFLGVHRPSITLITQSMREKGMIDYLRGKIFILDRSSLKASSCACYSTLKKKVF
ncbi:MAG: Crp/Fnr family transcriptional regulator [Pyrinomonadaceae bacterium]